MRSISHKSSHIKRSSYFRRLDQRYGYPPDVIVENFQQKLKAIKTLDRYSEFVKAIKMDDTIKTSEDMIKLIERSVEISDKQGYTKPRSTVVLRNPPPPINEQPRYNPQQRYYRPTQRR